MGLVSLPRAFVFRLDPFDPHPLPWVRVLLCCAIGDALYPDPQWAGIASVWENLYPTHGLHPRLLSALTLLRETMPAFVLLLVNHRPGPLRGRPLGEVLRSPDRAPHELMASFRRWSRAPDLMSTAAPTLVFAVLGQARASGLVSPEREQPATAGTHRRMGAQEHARDQCEPLPRRGANAGRPANDLDPGTTAI